MYNYKLLCTFCFENRIDPVLDNILDSFDSVNKIFIFKNKDNQKEYYITFNIDLNRDKVFKNFITVHRRKETNTLFSVNALNTIIKHLNNGVLDTSYQLDWTMYEDMLLLSNNKATGDMDDITRVKLELDEIVKV